MVLNDAYNENKHQHPAQPIEGVKQFSKGRQIASKGVINQFIFNEK